MQIQATRVLRGLMFSQRLLKRKTLLPFIALKWLLLCHLLTLFSTLPQFKIALLQVGEKGGKEKVSKNIEKSMVLHTRVYSERSERKEMDVGSR